MATIDLETMFANDGEEFEEENETMGNEEEIDEEEEESEY